MTTTTDIYIGAQLDFRGQDINLIPRTPINKVKTHGLELGLDSPLLLGTISQNYNDLASDFNLPASYRTFTELKESAKTGIDAIDNLLTTIGSASLTIEQLKVKMAPTQRVVEGESGNTTEEIPEADREENKYTFGASMTWEPQENGSYGNLIGALSIKGIYFLATTEGTAFDPAALEG